MRTALVHEWFDCFAGSEKVVGEFIKMFHEADLFSLVDFLPDDQRTPLEGKPVTTSFIQKLPFARKAFRHFLPLMPSAIEQFDLSSYDMVVSSNHAFAKGVITRADQLHVSYVHTPIRYAWDLQHEYLRQARVDRGLKSVIIRATLHYLRAWDRLAADRVDAFIANSRYIAERIRKTYRRPTYVVYPPVNVDDFQFCADKEDFYLTASRLVPYKRIDLIVDAFRQMPHRKLVVIGDGPELANLREKAGPNIEILGYCEFDVLLRYMQRAKAFVFAADEDFGIMPVEAQACGTPVIAYGQGGSRETVIDGHTGIHFSQQTPASVIAGVDRFDAQAHRFDSELIRRHAESFSPERFRREMMTLIEYLWDRFGHRRRNPASFDVRSTPFPFDPDQFDADLSSPLPKIPTVVQTADEPVAADQVHGCESAGAGHSAIHADRGLTTASV